MEFNSGFKGLMHDVSYTTPVNLLTPVLKSFMYIKTVDIKIKVKVTLVQALRLCTGCTAYRGSRGIALLFHDHGAKGGERSASSPDRSLPQGKTGYLLYRRLGGPQGWSGQVQKISPPPLYRLSYPAHRTVDIPPVHTKHSCLHLFCMGVKCGMSLW
jgi:hypothetical protein